LGLALVWGPILARVQSLVLNSRSDPVLILNPGFFYSKFRTGNLGTRMLAQVAKPKSPKKWELNNIGTFLKMWDQMAITSFHSLSSLTGSSSSFWVQNFTTFWYKKWKIMLQNSFKTFFCQIFKKTSPQFIANCITKVWDSFVPVFFTILNTYIHV